MREPGRELDAIVAEKVMGWEFVAHGVGSFDSGHWEKDGRRAHASSKENPLPYYSTSIGDAWLVVEKLRMAVAADEDGTGWVAAPSAYYLDTGEAATADTPMLAICLAALKAVGA